MDAAYQRILLPVADKLAIVGFVWLQKLCEALPVGAFGIAGCELITVFPDGTEPHPVELATVNVYVLFAVKPVIVVVVVEPVCVEVLPPVAVAVTVHVPEGRPLKATLPVATEQVGWVIAPTVGALGEVQVVFKIPVANVPK